MYRRKSSVIAIGTAVGVPGGAGCVASSSMVVRSCSTPGADSEAITTSAVHPPGQDQPQRGADGVGCQFYTEQLLPDGFAELAVVDRVTGVLQAKS